MFRVELTEFEESKYKSLFDYSPEDPFKNWEQRQKDQTFLFNSLASRNGIPKIRMEWFINPDFYPGGRGKSRRNVFEKNGTIGPAIVAHPNFMKFIKYFIDGPSLPIDLMRSFETFTKTLGQITSGDIEPLRTSARKLAREHGLTRASNDEFYKLCIELEIPLDFAESVRTAVSSIR